MRDRTRFLANGAVLLGVCLMLSYLEALLLPSPLPGVKLGIANITVVYTAFRYSIGMAAAVSLSRILLQFFLFGGGASVLFSLAGGVAVLVLLAVVRKLPSFCSYIGISVLCAFIHTAAQLCFAVIFFRTAAILWNYGGILLLCAVVCGFGTGAICNLIDPVLQKALRHTQAS